MSEGTQYDIRNSMFEFPPQNTETQKIVTKLCEEIITLANSGASTKDLHFRAKALEAYLLVVRRYENQG